MQVDNFGCFPGLDCLHSSIQGMSDTKPCHPLLTMPSMTSPAWGPGSLGVSSLCVGTFFSLPLLLLTSGRVAVGMTGIVGIFIPFSHTIDLLYAIGGTILFSGYIVYDTYLINSRLSPDEYIMAAISLYLECVPTSLSLSLLDQLIYVPVRGVALSTYVGCFNEFPSSRCSNALSL